MMKNILQYLEMAAEKYPHKTAFADDTQELSFSELISMSRRGGSLIAGRGVKSSPVAVFMKKSPQTVAAFLAVIYAGCSYVPLEAGMPLHRIRKILQKLDPAVIICDETGAAKTAQLGYSDRVLDAQTLFSADEDAALLRGIRAAAIDTDPIYIVFTSGSTGEPKGVTGCHRALIDYAEALCPVIGADENSVFAMQVPLYVDACMKEILSVIKCGSTAYLMPQSLFMSPLRALDFLNRHRVNTVCWVASALTLISGLGAFDEAVPEHLKTVCFGSEVFPAKQLRAWQRVCPGARFINLYGPTECTGMSFYYEVRREFSDGESIPIGRPFDNTGYMLLREDGSPAADGEAGEICIRGTALTLGYYDDPERTAAVFTQNPLNPHYPELIYRTGDLARLNDTGDLVFIARRDSQIKNMGHRIEPGEIESCACTMSGVESACCLWDKERARLVLFCMGSTDEKALMRYLRAELPRHMIPSMIIFLDTLPMLPNGKTDRAALYEIYKNQEK